MESHQGYLRRLAEVATRLGQARPDPDVVVERAAGLLAGRAGCQVNDAYAYLLQLAAERGRDHRELAAELLRAMEGEPHTDPDRIRVAAERALRAADRPVPRPRSAPPGGTGGWTEIVQGIVSALPGRHTVLVPVRDAAGEIEDFTFVAVSAAVVDLSGRTGWEIVGRRVSDTYPTLVDGPVWNAWREAVVDGAPRQVGPVPYVPSGRDSPTPLTISVRVQPIGSVLLSSWVRHDEEERLADRIAQTERLGNLGWGEWDLVTGRVEWSDGLYRIFERDPALGPLPSGATEDLTVPEDRPIRRQAAEVFGRGETADITYRIRLGDRVKYVRAIADAVRDADGRPIRIYGIMQDVTAREASRRRLAEVERQLREQQQTLAAEHRLAAQLQQIVLPIPTDPIDLPGLRVAVRYLPAEQASRVGGDWYHAATGRDGTVVLAVGDVAGHGILAATTMAQIRHALAALSITMTTDPAALLTHLNDLLYADGRAARTVTAVLARYDPATGVLVWAQAGHVAPLHARNGVTTQLPRPRGPLLGAIRAPGYRTATVALAAGDLLLLYTDGLIEHRRHTMAEGLAPVIATLSRISARQGPQPCVDILAQLRRANPDDDTCILAAQPRPAGDATPAPVAA
jgi:serine phosphatase RsbU (regulator of sigma subunit)